MARDVLPEMAAAIKVRREDLELSLDEFVRATGLTRQGLAPLLAGERRNYQERLTMPVCRVLRWTTDSIDRLLRGEPAVPLTPRGGDPGDRTALEILDEMGETLLDFGERIAALEARARRDDDPDPADPPASPTASRRRRR